MSKLPLNTGLIEKVRPTDDILGVNENKIRKILFKDGDCTNYLPTLELQHGVYGDTSGCVTFSSANVIETNLNKQAEQDNIIKGILETLNLYDRNSKVNCCDRIIAKHSGTGYRDSDPFKGNYYTNVANSWRKIGLLAEDKYPYPRLQRTPVFSLDDYYKELTEYLINESKKSLKFFEIRYTLIPVNQVNLREQLQYGPIQVGYYTRSPKVNGMYQNADSYHSPGHAVMLYNQSKGDNIKRVFDHYIRGGDGKLKFAPDFRFGHWGLQYYITLKDNNNNMNIKDGQMYLLVEGNEQKLAMGYNGQLVIYTKKVDTILNSAGKLGKFKAPISVGINDWNSVPHVNGKLESID